MKPIGRKNYGSIPHLSNSKLGEGDYFIGAGQEAILTKKKRDRHDKIFVFEKYDGSNVGIAKIDNEIIPLTRAGYNAKISPYKQHNYFAEWVSKNENIFSELLSNGDRIVGEWMAQAHGIIYKIEVEPIVFFDYFNINNERLINEELSERVLKFNLNLPRILHQGEPVEVERILPILNEKTSKIQSVEPPEGLVYRVERKGRVDFLAKWVRHDFPAGKYCINVPDENIIWNVDYII
jgi:ATP-dependent RNA circularization protein (DNA/RNA ligase family)